MNEIDRFLLDKNLQDCKNCRFWDSEVNVYDKEKGYGKFGAHAFSDKAKIMIVGQNPSHRREPFPNNFSLSGPQGKLFREIMGEENLILTNLVKISTPDNSINMDDACHGLSHLMEEIKCYEPELVIGLGSWCRRILSQSFPKQWKETVLLNHPDYYLTYNQGDIEWYRNLIKETFENFKKTY